MKELILYALRRFCMLIPFLIGLTLVAFLLGVLSPGDPALALLTMDGTSEPTAEELDALRHAMGLDQPVWIQYGRWLMNALHGDLGVSILHRNLYWMKYSAGFPLLSISRCGPSAGYWLSAYPPESGRQRKKTPQGK